MISRKKPENLENYLKEIKQIPLIRAAEEKELALKGDDESKRKLAQGNLSLVIRIAEKFKEYHPTINLMDLIQEGNLGLYKAVDMYVKHKHYEKEYKFSTYATWWIRQAIISKLGL